MLDLESVRILRESGHWKFTKICFEWNGGWDYDMIYDDGYYFQCIKTTT